jgi:hypothetical protein
MSLRSNLNCLDKFTGQRGGRLEWSGEGRKGTSIG